VGKKQAGWKRRTGDLEALDVVLLYVAILDQLLEELDDGEHQLLLLV
jgi:hypothetical protein